MRFLQADVIFPIHSAPLTDHVLVVQDNGVIESIIPIADADPLRIERFEGYLVPGFVNAHCHLELSHLRGEFPEKTGLPGFLSLVVQKRISDPDRMQQAMIDGDAEMYRNGIVAVGDISNRDDSFQVKSRSKLIYHTFVELLAFDPARAAQQLDHGHALLAKAHAMQLRASLVPHAPYSINEVLVRGIMQACVQTQSPTSIHMLESNDENELYVRSTGLYRKLYREMGIAIDQFFSHTGKTALESVLPWFDTHVPTMLVHNTIATAWDADWAEGMHPHLHWCFCPNANLYIEDRLPDIPMLMQHVQYICIGTDSLASNHQLSLLHELGVIHRAYPEIGLNDLFRWATLYGAKALQLDDTLGSFQAGKQPGVNLVTGFESAQTAKVQRII